MVDSSSAQSRQVSTLVTYYGPAKRVVAERQETFMAGEKVRLTVIREKGRISRERTYRASISNLQGPAKEVMNDLYRHLVISNYTFCDGESGYYANRLLDVLYPSQGALRDFEYVTYSFNTSGEIYHNLRIHRTTQDYLLLGSILDALLREHVEKEPTVHIETARWSHL